jgi:hypothetical protein
MILLLWFLYIFGEAYGQSIFFKKDESFKPDYRILWIIRGIFSILHGILLQIKVEFYELEPLYMIGFQMCSFWILFDLILNELRGKPWHYIGGSDSSKFDRIAPIPYWILKAFALIGVVLFYHLYHSA